jgi:hypothetical protein
VVLKLITKKYTSDVTIVLLGTSYVYNKTGKLLSGKKHLCIPVRSGNTNNNNRKHSPDTPEYMTDSYA